MFAFVDRVVAFGFGQLKIRSPARYDMTEFTYFSRTVLK